MDLRQALLWGMVLPQAHLAEQVVSSQRDPSIAFPSSETQIDAFSRVQRARLEVRAVLLELDKRLSTAKRGFLHAGRLTTADIVAVAVLDGVVSIVCQGWVDYPHIRTYMQRMRTLPGYVETSAWRQGIVDDVARMLRNSEAPIMI